MSPIQDVDRPRRALRRRLAIASLAVCSAGVGALAAPPGDEAPAAQAKASPARAAGENEPAPAPAATLPAEGTAPPAPEPEPEPPPYMPPKPPPKPTMAIDASVATAEFAADFRGKPFNVSLLKLDGKDAEQLVRPEETGLRIRIPANQGKPRPVGVATKFKIRGDFEISSSFEVLKAERPKEGYGIGVLLSIETDSPRQDGATAEWTNQKKDGEVFSSTRVTTGADGGRRFDPRSRPTRVRSGTLRLTRVGALLEVAYSEKGAPFVQMRRMEFGREDVTHLILAANTGWSNHPVDIRLQDLKIRAEELPGYIDRPRRPSYAGWWLAGGAGVLGLVGAGVWMRGASHRGPAPVAVMPSMTRDAAARAAWPPDADTDDPWGAGFERLEAMAVAFARDFPDADGMLASPLFQFALDDGRLHGPFIVWGELGDDDGAVHRPWREMRQKLPRRFEGEYRRGLRHGEFVYRDASGAVVCRCYQEGELVT